MQAANTKFSTAALVFLVIFAVIGACVAWGLLKTGYALEKQACIDRAVGEYPAVSVSAYNSAKATGALKLSYDAERRAAVRDC